MLRRDFGALSGGIGAELSGGNFWQGAVIGGIVAGLNSAMHKMGDPPRKVDIKIKRQPWDLNGDGKLQKNEADRWWLVGNGQEITVDNRLISWKGLQMPSDIPIGQKFPVNTHEAFINLPYETAATYGGTSFIRTGQYTAEVQNQSYHYNYRSNNTPTNIIRNIMTKLGEPFKKGIDYMIKYKNPIIHFRSNEVLNYSKKGSHYTAY